MLKSASVLRCLAFILTGSCVALLGVVRENGCGTLYAMQASCENEASEGNTTTIDPLAEAESSCFLPPSVPFDSNGNPMPWVATDSDISGGGSFVKTNTDVKLDVVATVSGKCTWKAMSGWPPSCTVIGEAYRTISKATVISTPPVGNPGPNYYYGTTSNGQYMDSRVVPPSSGSVVKKLLYQGKYDFALFTTINQTACDIAPGESETKHITVNAMKCKPFWWTLVGKTYHAPPTSIQVYINPVMWNDLHGPAAAAAAAWNALLTGSGISLNVVNSDCGAGGDCVRVTEDWNGSGCAGTTPGLADSSGQFIEPSLVQLPPNWRSRSDSRNQRSMAHEFGHLLSLGHYVTCTNNDSVMAPVPDCTSPLQNLSPTGEDARGTSSTYGNKSQKVCGFSQTP